MFDILPRNRAELVLMSLRKFVADVAPWLKGSNVVEPTCFRSSIVGH